MPTACWISDVHAPFQDDLAFRVMLDIIAVLQPDLFVAGGDWCDFQAISRFDTDPRRKLQLATEIELAKLLLKAVAVTVPSARRVFKQGNHEHRLDRWRYANPEIGMLPGVALPELLGFAESGFEYVTAMQRLKWQGITLTHGDLCRKRGGATAQAMIDKFGTSGVSGHVHRLAVVSKRDASDFVWWAESGCLCRLDPEYAEVCDWAQGFVVLTAEDGQVWPELVEIREGRAFFRGRWYEAAGRAA
jgi:hypothetical protein